MFSKKKITKALIALPRCTGWYAPLLFSNPKDRYSRMEPPPPLKIKMDDVMMLMMNILLHYVSFTYDLLHPQY